MQTLFLHAGAHTTSAQALQAELAGHAEGLARRGVKVRLTREGRGAPCADSADLAGQVLRGGLNTASRLAGAARPGGLSRAAMRMKLAAFLSDRSVRSFVISTEDLCFARTEDEFGRLSAWLTRKDLRIAPVLVLRNEADWRRAWRASTRNWPGGAAGFGAGTDDPRDAWYFDTKALLSFFGRLGRARLVDYDAAVQRHGTVLPAIFQAMEIAAPAAGGNSESAA